MRFLTNTLASNLNIPHFCSPKMGTGFNGGFLPGTVPPGKKSQLCRYLRADETVDIDTALQELGVVAVMGKESQKISQNDRYISWIFVYLEIIESQGILRTLLDIRIISNH